jgi:hypothetical protein
VTQVTLKHIECGSNTLQGLLITSSWEQRQTQDSLNQQQQEAHQTSQNYVHNRKTESATHPVPAPMPRTAEKQSTHAKGTGKFHLFPDGDVSFSVLKEECQSNPFFYGKFSLTIQNLWPQENVQTS